MIEIRIDDRLVLRQRQLADAEETFALTEANRAYLRTWLPWLDDCTSLDDTRESIRATLAGAEAATELAVAIWFEGRIVGVTGFHRLVRVSRVGYIGYWIGEAHQGGGLMTASVRALVEYGFTTLGLNRQVIAAATGNMRSRAIAERLGFHFEGIAREAVWVYDHFNDHAIYGLTRSEWQRPRTSAEKVFSADGWRRPVPQNFAGRFITLAPVDLDADVAELHAGSHQPNSVEAMWRYTPGGPFADAATMRGWLSGLQAQPDAIPFTVHDNATRRRVGHIALLRITPVHGVAELGFIWYEPAAQRTKANTEANYLLLRHCFAELGYRRMEWKCDAANEPSKRAARRLGYQYEGTFRQHMVVHGVNRDTAWFAMLDHEWPRAAAALEHWLYMDDTVPLAQLRAP